MSCISSGQKQSFSQVFRKGDPNVKEFIDWIINTEQETIDILVDANQEISSEYLRGFVKGVRRIKEVIYMSQN